MNATMGIKTQRRIGGTREAAKVAGCSMGRIRHLIIEGRIWSELVGDKMRVVDLDEVAEWAAEQARKRAAGTATGPPPGGFRPDNPGREARQAASKQRNKRAG